MSFTPYAAAKVERIFELTKKNAKKFGSSEKTPYLCIVKTQVLATPLSAGSKALQILLHLNKRLHHVWCGFFIARIFCGTVCRTLGFGLHICLRRWSSCLCTRVPLLRYGLLQKRL